MLGYDVSWAAFNIVEVMSSSKFTYKVRGNVENNASVQSDQIHRFTSVIIYVVNYLFSYDTFFSFSANRIPCGITMLSWGHWCHHADDQSDPQGAFWTSCSPVFVSIALIAIGFFIISHQDLSSPNQYDTGVALTGLSCFVTPDLARDLANDIMTLVKPFRLFTSDKYWHIEHVFIPSHPSSISDVPH